MSKNPIPDNLPRMGGPRAGGQARFMPREKAKDIKGTIKRLMAVFSREWKLILLAICLTFVGTGITLVTPYLIGEAINTFDIVKNSINQSLLLSVLVALVVAYVLSFLINMLNGWLMAFVSQRIVKFLRLKIFQKLNLLPLGFFDTTPHGDTMSRITNDVDNLSSTIAQTTTDLISNIISIIGSLIIMLVLSRILTLAAVITIPLIFLLTKMIGKRSRDYFVAQQKALGSLNGVIEESITSVKMVKAFNQEQNIISSFDKVNRELTHYSIKAQVWSGLLMPFMNVINNLSFALIALTGGILATNGMISVGLIASFVTYSRQLTNPLNRIASMFNTILSALAGAERVFEILDEEEERQDKDNAIEVASKQGNVEFKNVSFSYDNDTFVLKDLNFKVKKGQVVALVGETGAGKTTIVNLLTGFYELNSGEILIDNVKLTDIKKADLRKYFSVVLQETFLFSGTIAENIKYSNENATMEEVINAAKTANADFFIRNLKDGYDTVVSGSVNKLSEGEKQLLAIARAVLLDTPILILDEATASVDTRTEKKIQNAMIKLMEGRTTFLIAHRLSTIKDADIIMVVGEKNIIEKGTHAELMGKKGAYYKMALTQLGEIKE